MEVFTVHTEDLNSYGFWVKTDGIDTSAFLRNPICLWNHHRSWRGNTDEVLPIGIWEELTKKDGNMTAKPKFDKDDEFAAKIATKVEGGFLRGASIGIVVLEWSENPEHLKAGQTRPTVTKSRLREISVCDIPSNEFALVLYDQEGNVLNLSEQSTLAQLPTLTTTQQKDMNELEVLALQMGLPKDANLASAQAKITELTKLAAENVALKSRIQAIEDQEKTARANEVKNLLDTAVTDGRLTAEQRPAFEQLFAANYDAAKTALGALQKPVSLSGFVNTGSGTGDGKVTHMGKTFSQLSKDQPDVLLSLKENNLQLFKELYKAEYGKDYKQ